MMASWIPSVTKFQQNFRDERHMPFEGVGAVNSEWQLQLPKNFGQFDYNTINDVIIHVSYTADYDELFREKVEEQNEELEGTLQHILQNQSLYRTFSFRQEFSTDFHRLTEQPLGHGVSIKEQANKRLPKRLKAECNDRRIVLTVGFLETWRRCKMT